MQVEKTNCIKWLFRIVATWAFPQQLCWPDAASYHMSQLLQCLFAETEMAAIANTSDSCHEAELDASCLLSDNYVSSRFMETCWLLLWLLMHFQIDIYHLLLRHGSSKSFMWLWKWPTSSLYITEQGGREGWRRTTGCLAGEEGLNQLMCCLSFHRLLYFSVLLIMPVQLWCEVMVCSGLGQRLAAIQSCVREDYSSL